MCTYMCIYIYRAGRRTAINSEALSQVLGLVGADASNSDLLQILPAVGERWYRVSLLSFVTPSLTPREGFTPPYILLWLLPPCLGNAKAPRGPNNYMISFRFVRDDLGSEHQLRGAQRRPVEVTRKRKGNGHEAKIDPRGGEEAPGEAITRPACPGNAKAPRGSMIYIKRVRFNRDDLGSEKQRREA